MRMRRVGWAVDYLDAADCLVKEPEAYKGKWKELLQTDTLHLELGCGKGKYSQELSRLHPDHGFIAVEMNQSAAGMAAKKFDEAGAEQKLKLLFANAQDLEEWFSAGEVDFIHLNFSDPWPKKRNAKRRLSAPSFLASYQNVLSEKGKIILKTDNPDLFEYSVLQFADAGFHLDDISVNFRAEEHPEDPITEFEQKFMEEGKPIYRIVLGRN